MSSSLVDGLTDVFRAQALGAFTARSGESEASVLRGFQASIGAMVAGLAAKLKQAGFASQAMDLINNPANDAHVLEDARGLVDGQNKQSEGLGSRFTSMLFGGRLSAITGSISNVSGLRGESAASLMSVSAPLFLGALMQRIRQAGMDPSRLTNYLSAEAAEVGTSLPMGVKNALGSESEQAAPVAMAVVREKSHGWLWALLLAAVAVLGLIWWFGAGGVQTVKNSVESTAQLITRSLPGNISLRIPAGRMEDRLLVFIEDPAKPINGTAWFDFDRLLFDTNAATLQPASQEQLQNIAAILKAYPNVHVTIAGFTDNTGDPSANQLLSQQRADSVKQELTNMGVSADRLEARGYGEQLPVADNSTPEGRQQNRRISLLVTQK